MYTYATNAFAAMKPNVSAPYSKIALISACVNVVKTTSFAKISAIAQSRSLLPEPS